MSVCLWGVCKYLLIRPKKERFEQHYFYHLGWFLVLQTDVIKFLPLILCCTYVLCKLIDHESALRF